MYLTSLLLSHPNDTCAYIALGLLCVGRELLNWFNWSTVVRCSLISAATLEDIVSVCFSRGETSLSFEILILWFFNHVGVHNKFKRLDGIPFRADVRTLKNVCTPDRTAFQNEFVMRIRQRSSYVNWKSTEKKNNTHYTVVLDVKYIILFRTNKTESKLAQLLCRGNSLENV